MHGNRQTRPGGRSRLLAGAAVVWIFASACYDPRTRSCTVRCAANGSCPAGSSCGSDGFCHPGDDGTLCSPPPTDGSIDAQSRPDADLSPDASPVPAGMVEVPGGDFWMGCNGQSCEPDQQMYRLVDVPEFWIHVTEVTQASYGECIDAGECTAPGCTAADCEPSECLFDPGVSGDEPVVCLSWAQADAYCRWRGARLPVEAEWEKAARGLDGQKYPWGDAAGEPCVEANFSDCAGRAPVGSYPAGDSTYRLKDMAGNVWEWVQDAYNGGPTRVFRGGAHNSPSSDLLVYEREDRDPAKSWHLLGFRCAWP